MYFAGKAISFRLVPYIRKWMMIHLELFLEAKFSLDRFHVRWSKEAMEALEMKAENQQDPDNPQNSEDCCCFEYIF